MRIPDRTARGVWIEPSGNGKALVVDGAVQSVSLESHESVFGYWPLMLPQVRPSHALILGLGGGTLVQLLIRRFGALPVTAIDDDERVIGLATTELGLDPSAVEIIKADAFTWVTNSTRRFDYIAIDLFRGGEVPRTVFSPTFLHGVRRLLQRRGVLVVNLALDAETGQRIDRLSRSFRVDHSRTMGKNVIVHARSRVH